MNRSRNLSARDPVDRGMMYFRHKCKTSLWHSGDVVELLSAMASFGLGNVGFSGMMVAASQFLRGIREESYTTFGEDLFESHIARLIYPESRALVQAHLKKGHTVAIISSATLYQVRPAGRELGIEHVICTELEVEDGVFTGTAVHPTCFGPGKVATAETLSERVSNPRPLNPNNKLLAVAERNGWPVRKFGSRGQPGVVSLLRSMMVPASLVGSFFAGFPIWALTGSKRDAR